MSSRVSRPAGWEGIGAARRSEERGGQSEFAGKKDALVLLEIIDI